MTTRNVKQVFCDQAHGRQRQPGRTIQFSWDGVNYEFDVCANCETEAVEAMEWMVLSARRKRRPRASAKATASRKSTSKGRSTSKRETPAQRQEIRDWARSKGYDIGSRGRISAEVRAEFKKDKAAKRKAAKKRANKPSPAQPQLHAVPRAA